MTDSRSWLLDCKCQFDLLYIGGFGLSDVEILRQPLSDDTGATAQRRISNLQEKSPYFRLENDNDPDDTKRCYLVKDGRDHFHPEQPEQPVNEE